MRIIITGGAGFIGCNAASYYLSQKADVIVFDNFSRFGAIDNMSWLEDIGGNLTVIRGDVRNTNDIEKLVGFLKTADAVLHLAGQVAVTTSIIRPYNDFEINALGTLNMLEVMRTAKSKAKLIYSSSNKVYGSMQDIKVVQDHTRYRYENLAFGVSEERNLDFHSPYGCSKGSADQYVHDYARIYGLDTVVMRQSCIYGPRQYGIEDQGWMAWFMIASKVGKPLTIYGNGKQVRDVLYVDDLISAYDMAIKAGNKTKGGIYNIGGGLDHTLSVWHEFEPILNTFIQKPKRVTYKKWRLGDQKVYISDIRKAKKDFGWEPKTGLQDGISQLYRWVDSAVSTRTY